MQHEYRKTATIKAEQFDGSEEMRRKYRICDGVVANGFQDSIETVLPVGASDPNTVNLIKKVIGLFGLITAIIQCLMIYSARLTRGWTDEETKEEQ